MSKVLLIGLSGADWQHLQPLIDEQKLPTLARLIKHGSSVSLTTPTPLGRVPLWTTIATGYPPAAHQVFQGAFKGQPATQKQWQKAPFWAQLHQAKQRCQIYNWPGTHTPEPQADLLVSDLPEIPDAFFPNSLAQELRDLAVQPEEIDGETLKTLIPLAHKINQSKDPRLALTRDILANTFSLHQRATWGIENQPWDFAAICYNGLHDLLRHFAPYHHAVGPGIWPSDRKIFQSVLSLAYQLFDALLARLLDLAGSETTTIVLSEHGWTTPNGIERQQFSDDSLTPKAVFIASGPAIPKETKIRGGKLEDIAPTILNLYPKSVSKPRGRNLLNPEENLSYPLSSHKTKSTITGDPQWDIAQARYFTEQGLYAEALPITETLYSNFPENDQLRHLLATLLLAQKQLEKARLLLFTTHDSPLKNSFILLQADYHQLSGNHSQSIQCLTSLANSSQPQILAQIGFAAIQAGFFDLAKTIYQKLESSPDFIASALTAQAWCLQHEDNFQSALSLCERALSHDPQLSRAHFVFGIIQAKLGDLTKATSSLETALALDPKLTIARNALIDLLNPQSHILKKNPTP